MRTEIEDGEGIDKSCTAQLVQTCSVERYKLLNLAFEIYGTYIEREWKKEMQQQRDKKKSPQCCCMVK